MARQFKASTFFNKYIPNYCLNGFINGSKESYYSYMFTEKKMGQEFYDLLESRMLVVLYSIISVHENKLIIPSGKTVNLNDFSKNAFRAIKLAPKNYYHTSIFTDNDSSDYIHLLFTHDIDDLGYTNESLQKANFYDLYNFDFAIASKSFEITNYLSDNTLKDDIDFCMAFDQDKSKKILELLSLTKKEEPIKKTFYKKLLSVFKNENKISVEKKSINFEDLESSLKYSPNLLKDLPRFEIFKLINEIKKNRTNSSKIFKNIYIEMDEKIKNEKNKLSELEELAAKIKKEKNDFINSFKKHYDVYSESKIREDTLKKMENNYDLLDSVNLFSCYPYSSRQYENQAYIPLMIKAPIKKITSQMITDVENMAHDFPQFIEVINYIAISLKIRELTDGIVNFKHLLIVGEHGIGKNAFVRSLNNILGYSGNTINMTSVMAPFELSGMDAGWSGSAPGFFFNAIMKNNAANPIVVLDDLDKVNVNSSHGNINTTIIELIEPSNAKKYYERFFQIDLNMSYTTVIGLANNIDDVDRGVLDLLKVFKIDKPSVTSISSIVFSIYKDLKSDTVYSFTELTDNELNEIVVKFIISKNYSPRRMKKVIEDTLNNKLIETVKSKEDNKETLPVSPDDNKDTVSFQLMNKEK